MGYHLHSIPDQYPLHSGGYGGISDTSAKQPSEGRTLPSEHLAAGGGRGLRDHRDLRTQCGLELQLLRCVFPRKYPSRLLEGLDCTRDYRRAVLSLMVVAVD